MRNLPQKILVTLSISTSLQLFAQKDTVLQKRDTDTLTVAAFASQTRWQETPAAVVVIRQQQLQRFDRSSPVSVLNSIAGVRMEERSPGSYRLSVRGSLLRSPFGVRNVKVYWDDIPLTDAGGNTYINLLDFGQLTNIEIIKGPASSLYGANTGGVLLLQSQEADTVKRMVQANISGGSYGLFNEQLSYTHNSSFQVRQNHLQSDGYRQQSALRRDVVQANGELNLSKAQKLSYLAMYSDLQYQTPGGITLPQMESNPRLARQPAGAIPGAVQQQTAIYNKTALGGVNLNSQIGKHFDNNTAVTINHTDFSNPFITNYEKRNEWNYGGRTAFRYHVEDKHIRFSGLIGGEWQQNKSNIDDYGNRAGKADTVQFKDIIKATQSFVFAQAQITINNRWHLQAGLSRNVLVYRFQRTTDPAQAAEQKRNIGPLWAPRFSALYQAAPGVNMYAIVSKGFSPPTVAEVRPSDGNYYGDLQPEYGWNYEAGIKGNLWQQRLQYDVSFYYFGLKDAIVRRSSTSGAEYFVNAGVTSQKGVEAFVKAWIVRRDKGFVTGLALSQSYSYQPYRFTDYVSGGVNYSGNQLTGVPRNISVTGLDARFRNHIYTNITFNYTSSLPLTDANDAFAKAYHLFQAKAGYQIAFRKVQVDVYAGMDNILNEVYSLGNDINAVGKRYYNPAPGRSVFAGVAVGIK
ncbi:MAG: TonB-dependent receptor [Filimonas sp.]|nr:TonB-dependent receptor [Filimonas sp.]